MNEKAAELGLDEHALRRSVGPAVGQRVVGLRHGAADRVRVERRAHRVDHAEEPSTRSRRRRRAITFRSTNHLLGREDVDVRAGKTGFITQGRLLPGDAAAAAADRPAGRGRRPRRALERRPVHGRRRTCSTGSPPRRRRSSRRRRLYHPARLTADFRLRSDSSASHGLSQLLLNSRSRSTHLDIPALHRRRVERQRGDRVDRDHHRTRPRCGRRTPSDSAGRRRRRRRDTGRRASRTT